MSIAVKHLPVTTIPEIQTDFSHVSVAQERPVPLTDANSDAAFVPLTRLSVPNVTPPEVQRVVVEHIVKSEDTASSMHIPLKLRFFSGKSPRPGNEVDYDAWHNSVELMLQDPSISDLARSRKILDSLLPPAADVVRTLGPRATPRAYLDLLDSAFGAVEDGDELFAKFLSTLQDTGEKPSQYLQRLQVTLTLAIKRGGVSSNEADRHLLRQFCRGCWDNALISELRLEQRKTDPPLFSELLLLLRTAEDKQSTKELRMRKHLGASKQRASSYSLSASTDETSTTQAMVLDLKKQITELQGQVNSLKKAKEQTKGPLESMAHSLQNQVAELQTQMIAVKPTKAEKAKSAVKMSKSQYVQTNLGETSHSSPLTKMSRPKPWYCFQCGEDGHIASSCGNVANPAMVASKRKLLKERQSAWDTQMGLPRSSPLN
nr:zinc finger CCHC domain-containing protein 18-like [Misgurnus anguillicaudatus]